MRVALRVDRALFLSLIALLAAALFASLAAAQSAAPTSLTNVQLLAEGPNQSVFQVTLSPTAGSYSAVNNDPSRPALMLLRTRRDPGLDQRREYRGLVRTVEVEPTDSGLAVGFDSVQPAKLKVDASGTNKLLVTVIKLTGAEAVGSRPIASEDEVLVPATGLPPAYDPCPGEDGYELVMLKYADVSEVVGLLSNGVTVKPNNVFIRREPGFGSLGANTTTTYSTSQGQVAQRWSAFG